jgi:hypothetical protein
MESIKTMDTDAAAPAVGGAFFRGMRGRWAYFCISVLAGLVLMFAAVMKWESPIDTMPIVGGMLMPHWAKVTIVLVEIVLGLWLTSGAFAKMARNVAMGCFGLFLCVAIYEAWKGAESCGCFGNVHVHPIYTAVFDAVMVVAISIARPGNRHGLQWIRPVLLSALPIMVGTVSGAAGIIAHREGRTFEAEDDFAPGQLVVLEPEKWVGKRLPILKYIDKHEELSGGKWTIILYRHDCYECREEVPKFQEKAQENAGQYDGGGMAFVEMPPYGKTDELIPPQSPCLSCRLNDAHDWFVQTPVVIRVNDGVVIAAFRHIYPL